MLFVFLFSLFLIGSCFFVAWLGESLKKKSRTKPGSNGNFKPALAFSSGVLLSLCFLDFLPQAFQASTVPAPAPSAVAVQSSAVKSPAPPASKGHSHGQEDRASSFVFGAYGISLLMLLGILGQALADIYLLPYLSFFDRFLESKSQKKVPHSHTFSPISVCSVTGCLSLCSFFDGIRLLTAFNMEASVAGGTALALFVHLLSEGVLIAVLALSSGFKKSAILLLVGILGGALMLGATLADLFARWFSFPALLAFSSGCLLYICFVHLLPSALKTKHRLWFFVGLFVFSSWHFLH